MPIRFDRQFPAQGDGSREDQASLNVDSASSSARCSEMRFGTASIGWIATSGVHAGTIWVLPQIGATLCLDMAPPGYGVDPHVGIHPYDDPFVNVAPPGALDPPP